MHQLKKILFLAPVFFLMSVFLAVPAVAQATEEPVMKVEIKKSVTSVKCEKVDDHFIYVIKGKVEVKNESKIDVKLTAVRDWLHKAGANNTALTGDYTLSVTDGQGFSWTKDYDVTSAKIGDQAPAFMSFKFGPVDEGKTVILNYTLKYKGELVEDTSNTIQFAYRDQEGKCLEKIACSTTPAFEKPVCEVKPTPTPTPTQTVTPTPTPSATVTVTPTPTVSPQVLGEVSELPATGSETAFQWLYYGFLGILMAALFWKLSVRKNR